MSTNWQQKQIEVSKGLIQQGSQALRQGDFGTANAALSEAAAILDMAEDESVEILQMRAQVLNETGFILQRANQPERAIENHEKAVALCNDLMERGVEFRGNSAATHINLAGLLAGQGEFDRAKEANRKAIELAESLIAEGKDATHAQNLAFGANQNYAVIAGRAGDFEDADRAMRRSMEIVEVLGEKQQFRGIHAQAAQGCQQLSVMLFHAKKYDQALDWGRRAEKLSERAYKDLGQQALPIYVTSQINLISYYEKDAQFAEAENCLFKALEVVGNHPQILARGKTFYEECRKQADSRLEAGDLPREEVEDGYEEILNRIEEIGGIEELMAQVQAAEAAAAGDDSEEAEA